MKAAGLANAVIGLIFCSVLSTPGFAQGNETSAEAKHRADCRLAEQILTLGQPANKRDWALRIIGTCPQMADVLPDLWEEPPSGEAELERLFSLSRKVRDRGIYEAALRLVEDPTRSSNVRITALGVLGAYIDSDLVVDLSGLTRVEGIDGIEWNKPWGWGGDLGPQEQGDPLPPDHESTTLALIERLSEQAEDAKLCAAAWWLSHRLP